MKRATKPPKYGYGAILRACRESVGISQAELARRARCSAPLISQVECGRRPLSPGLAERLALAMGLAAPEEITRRGMGATQTPGPEARRAPALKVTTKSPELPPDHRVAEGACAAMAISSRSQRRHRNQQRTLAPARRTRRSSRSG